MPNYNANPFPVTYQNPYYQYNQMQQSYQQQMPMQPQMPIQQPVQRQSNNGVNWVQGEAGAKSWLTAPNETVMLMDSEADVFYLKSADASGVPLPLRIFDYRERTSDAHRTSFDSAKDKTIEYATKADLNALEASIKDQVAEMFSGVATKAKKKVNADE